MNAVNEGRETRRETGRETGRGVLTAAAADAPRQAGVYFFLDERGEVLYVGKASNLCQRLHQHAATMRPEPRLHRKYDLVRRVVWELAADEETAVWREADLIFALRPPFNANPDLRATDRGGTDARVPYVIVTEAATGMISLTVEPDVAPLGRAYGCFPHLGKGKGSRLGVACSDGYTAFLRLLWAAADPGTHMPAPITRAAPAAFTVPVAPGMRVSLHRFLNGTRARLADELLHSAANRPDYMQPALRRDKESARRFFAAGPQLLRARRLRHRIRARTLDVETYRRLVTDEIGPIINGADLRR